MDTESDKEILDLSITEEERQTGDTDRHETTDTADEERQPMVGDHAVCGDNESDS